jgi:ParB family transcriptional regulator, chromosome partitioning protein
MQRPDLLSAKVDAHVAKAIAAKPEMVQISTAYGQQKEGSTTLPRNKYTAIRAEKPSSKEEAKRPEFKTCKFTKDAIVIEGNEKGELRKVCSNPVCSVHHPQKESNRDDGKWKAEQENRRREETIANAIGIRVLAAVSAAVPIRLLKRDLQFLVDQIDSLLDEKRLHTWARKHGIRKDRETDAIVKLFASFVRRTDEGTLSRLLVESTILLAASRPNPRVVLRDAAAIYKIDTDAIALKVKQEFAAKQKTNKAAKPTAPKAAKTNKPLSLHLNSTGKAANQRPYLALQFKGLSWSYICPGSTCFMITSTLRSESGPLPFSTGPAAPGGMFGASFRLLWYLTK